MRKSLAEVIADHGGPSNVHFLAPMQERKEILFLRFTDSNTPFDPVIMRISEEHYKVEDDYKITLVADDARYGREDFYQMDLSSLLEEEKFQMFASGQKIDFSKVRLSH